MFEYQMYAFENSMCTIGYIKIPDIILSLFFSQKLDWTHTFGTYSLQQILKYTFSHLLFNVEPINEPPKFLRTFKIEIKGARISIRETKINTFDVPRFFTMYHA